MSGVRPLTWLDWTRPSGAAPERLRDLARLRGAASPAEAVDADAVEQAVVALADLSAGVLPRVREDRELGQHLVVDRGRHPGEVAARHQPVQLLLETVPE